jgi:uncharacterized membrane protein YkvA (DUF1232 family)
MNNEIALVELKKGYGKAEKVLHDMDKMEKFLKKLEEKLGEVPLAGDTLKKIPILVSLVRNYAKNEYDQIPVGSIVAIVSALLYWLSPVDLIPDAIPGIGYLDDALVIGMCLKLVDADLELYIAWKNENWKGDDQSGETATA